MTKQTTSLNLSKPEITDKIVDTITQLASNFDVIDSSLADIATKQGDLTQLNTTDKTSVVNAIKEIKTQANTNQASISNNATTIANIANGSPKGTYATVSALQTAYPTGTTGIYIVTADGGWYYWSGSAWVKGGTYQSTGIADGSIVNKNLGSKSVTPSNTSFTTFDMPFYLESSSWNYNGTDTWKYNEFTLTNLIVGKTYTFQFTGGANWIQVKSWDSTNTATTLVGKAARTSTLTIPTGAVKVTFDVYFVTGTPLSGGVQTVTATDIMVYSGTIAFNDLVQIGINNIANKLITYDKLSVINQPKITEINNSGLYPDYNTTTKILTFPSGFSVRYGNLNANTNKVDLSNKTLDLTPVVASNNSTIYYDLDTNSLMCRDSYGTQGYNTVLLGCIRKTDGIGSMIFQYTINGKFMWDTRIDVLSNKSSNIKVGAHRGANTRNSLPENSRASFEQAVKDGFSYLENDVRMTKDGVLVIHHDVSINRIARNPDGSQLATTLNVADLTLAELQQYDYGIYLGSQFAGTKMLLFDEWLDIIKRGGVYGQNELKIDASTNINDIISKVKRSGIFDKIIWIDFYFPNLQKIVAAEKTAKVGYLMNSPTTTLIDQIITLKNDFNEVYMCSDYNYLTQDMANYALDRNVGISTWTVNDKTVFNNLMSLGVTQITGDKYTLNDFMTS